MGENEGALGRITFEGGVRTPSGPTSARQDTPASEIPKLSSLLEMSKILSSALPLNIGINQVLSMLARHHGAFRSAVILRRSGADGLRIEEAVGLAKNERQFRWPAAEDITIQVIDTGKPVLVPRVSRAPALVNRAGRRRSPGNSEVTFMCVPIVVNYTAVGSLSVELRFKKGRPYERILKFFGVVGSMIGQAIKIGQLVDADHRQLVAENVQLREELRERYEFSNLVGNSGVIRQVYEQVAQAAGSDRTVLLRGEPGTGKELIARTIHYNSARKNGPFVTFSCAALPAHVIERELFGLEKAELAPGRSQRKGRLKMAEGGTLFLDEIGNLNGDPAQHLLRVLKETKSKRPGTTNIIEATRVLAATSKNLEHGVATGIFAKNLFDALNDCAIYIPPLRERKADVTLLVDHFLRKYAKQQRKSILKVSPTAIQMLMNHRWLGNVRELEDSIEKAVLICVGDEIQGHHLLSSVQSSDKSGMLRLSFKEAVEGYEKDLIEETLRNTKGNRSRAATLLQTTGRILNYKINKLKIDCDQFRS